MLKSLFLKLRTRLLVRHPNRRVLCCLKLPLGRLNALQWSHVKFNTKVLDMRSKVGFLQYLSSAIHSSEARGRSQTFDYAYLQVNSVVQEIALAPMTENGQAYDAMRRAYQCMFVSTDAALQRSHRGTSG